MDENIKQISEKLTTHSSRRGFFTVMGSVVLGAAALLAGQGFFAQAADASPACCTSGHAGPCATNSCPAGSTVRYTWRCGVNGNHYHVCHDCKDVNKKLVCVYATYH